MRSAARRITPVYKNAFQISRMRHDSKDCPLTNIIVFTSWNISELDKLVKSLPEIKRNFGIRGLLYSDKIQDKQKVEETGLQVITNAAQDIFSNSNCIKLARLDDCETYNRSALEVLVSNSRLIAYDILKYPNTITVLDSRYESLIQRNLTEIAHKREMGRWEHGPFIPLEEIATIELNKIDATKDVNPISFQEHLSSMESREKDQANHRSI